MCQFRAHFSFKVKLILLFLFFVSEYTVRNPRTDYRSKSSNARLYPFP